jgi:hypothetical protein
MIVILLTRPPCNKALLISGYLVNTASAEMETEKYAGSEHCNPFSTSCHDTLIIGSLSSDEFVNTASAETGEGKNICEGNGDCNPFYQSLI